MNTIQRAYIEAKCLHDLTMESVIDDSRNNVVEALLDENRDTEASDLLLQIDIDHKMTEVGILLRQAETCLLEWSRSVTKRTPAVYKKVEFLFDSPLLDVRRKLVDLALKLDLSL